jgi:hypothetical protein
MAFVEIDKLPGFDLETYHMLVGEIYGDGPQLTEGEMFRVAGTTGDGLVVLNAWTSREACDRTMAKWMDVFQKHQLSMEGVSHQEFEIHDVQLGAADPVAAAS